MSFKSPSRMYTHYLPIDSNNCRAGNQNQMRPSSSVTFDPTIPASATTDSSTIDHYLDRLNRNYRQITSQNNVHSGVRTRPKHSYDLYNNEDFYIRKYGDFLTSGSSDGEQATGHVARNRSRRGEIVRYCDLHAPGHHHGGDYEEPPIEIPASNYSARMNTARFHSPHSSSSPSSYQQRYCDKVFFRLLFFLSLLIIN